MKQKNICRSVFSLLLAFVMTLPMLPAARAAETDKCTCQTVRTRNVIKVANCHEQGMIEYICPNKECTEYNKSVFVRTEIDATNHDTVCTDNGDGTTHTATCRVHKDFREVSQLHTFVDGYCIKCMAADYATASLNMAKSVEFYVGLNDTQAALTIGDVKVTVGSADLTKDYTLSYSWKDQNGNTVSNSETCSLPASAVSKADDYTYACFVMAIPKAAATSKYIAESCTVTVHVRELVSASAIVNADGGNFAMDYINNRTAMCIFDQIYRGAYDLSDVYPEYVVFGAAPKATVGELKVEKDTRYYFEPTGAQQALEDVVFVPSGTAAGAYVVNFTVYDTKGKDYPGVLTILVERSIGAMDVIAITEKGQSVDLNAAQFEQFWNYTYAAGSLAQINFTELPSIKEGTLYYDYVSETKPGELVTTSDTFYSVFSNAKQKLIDGLTFVPNSKFSGHVTIPFDAYGLTDRNRNAHLSGQLSIFVYEGEMAELTWDFTNGEIFSLEADDFLKIHREVTKTTADNMSIKVLNVPQNGELYLNYTGTSKDKPLTDAVVSEYTFYYSTNLGEEIEDLTYVSYEGSKATEDILCYVACDNKGEFQYIGLIYLNGKSSVVVYTKSFADIVKSASTEWYYTPVMDLAEAGVINGFEEKVNGVMTSLYKPGGEVTYAQALKLIMLATGYAEAAPTTKHWASGYLELAKADGLVNSALDESYLDRKISRNVIAQIAAKAMKLPESKLTASPFVDVTVGSTYAPYIFALYDAGIVMGDNSSGSAKYYGVNSITRAEMAVIVWRINNYSK
ncbi:MAG: S-layer homology domain-containing protein [Oscillospiraceae bacterium]|nr:S-layer homology domain-containing protein [Oscillospiraceae bacterium]